MTTPITFHSEIVNPTSSDLSHVLDNKCSRVATTMNPVGRWITFQLGAWGKFTDKRPSLGTTEESR